MHYKRFLWQSLIFLSLINLNEAFQVLTGKKSNTFPALVILMGFDKFRRDCAPFFYKEQEDLQWRKEVDQSSRSALISLATV